MTIHDSEGNSYDDLTMWHLDQPVRSGEATYDKATDTFQATEGGMQAQLAKAKEDKSEAKPISFIYGRHGETDENDENRVRGQSDIPLNDAGRQDAEKLAESVSGSGVRNIVASPLPRAKETADIVGRTLGVPVETHPGLMAWDIGKADGEKDTGQLDKYCQGDKQDVPPPGSSESFNDFKQRVLSAVGDITSKYPEGLMLVGHNSTERTIAEHLNGEDYKNDGINPGDHKEFKIEHDDVFGKAFQSASTAYQQGNVEEGGKQAARFGRAALTSLLGKVAGTVTGPIEAAGRIIKRYEDAMSALRGGKPAPEFDPGEHVLDMMSVIGATSAAGLAPESSLAANSIKLVPKAPAYDTIVGNTKDFNILRNTPEGETISGNTYGTYNPRTGHLKVGWLGTDEPTTLQTGSEALKTNTHAHAYSISEVRDLIREAIKEFPEVKTIGGGNEASTPGGGRVSGVHSKTYTPQFFTVTDKMREQVLGKQPDLSGPLERSLGQLASQTERKGYIPAADPYMQQAYEPDLTGESVRRNYTGARTLEEGVQRFEEQMRREMEQGRDWGLTADEIANGATGPVSPQEIEAFASQWEDHVNDEFAQVPWTGNLSPRQAMDVYNHLGAFSGDDFRSAYRREASPVDVEEFESIRDIESTMYSKGSKEASAIASLKGPRESLGRDKQTGRISVDWGAYRRMKESGMDEATIAKELGVGRNSLWRARVREGQRIEPTTKPKQNVLYPLGQPKITINPNDLREDIKNNMSVRDMADKYKVSKPTMQKRINELK